MAKKPQKAGAPAWMSTFADLATLLMCFFVLLLSFSEMDVLKFKQIAGSMKYAFGVQNKIEVRDIPKGTSVIAQEFRPGRPEPTPIDVITQQTIDITQQSLDVRAGEEDISGGEDQDSGGNTAIQDAQRFGMQLAAQDDALEQSLQQALQSQVEDGAIEIENLGQEIIIRIREKGAFPNGSAFLQPKFRPVVKKIGTILADVPGMITITGHTDSEQVQSELYRSNWEIAALRAVSVGQEMFKAEGFQQSRVILRGVADNEPLVESPSNDAERSRNRRVEIAIRQGSPKISDDIQIDDVNS